MTDWIRICAAQDIEVEDVLRFQVAERGYAIYHTVAGYFATDDLCTHARARLSGGLVIGEVIECPLHQGRFHIPTGRALSPPACKNLQTYPVRVADDSLYIMLGSSEAGVPQRTSTT